MTPSKKLSVVKLMWKQGDFSIKLNLEKGEGGSNENMKLKYGRKMWKISFHPTSWEIARRAYKNEVTWSSVFQSNYISKKWLLSNTHFFPSEAGVLTVLISTVPAAVPSVPPNWKALTCSPCPFQSLRDHLWSKHRPLSLPCGCNTL